MFKRKFLLLLVILWLAGLVHAAQTYTVRALWTGDALVIINISDSAVDLAALTLQSPTGAITPAHWRMAINPNTTAPYSLTEVRPGECLIAYYSGTNYTLPANVTCVRVIGEAALASSADLVWEVQQGSFTPMIDAIAGTPCDTSSSNSCDITAQPPHTNPMETPIPTQVTVRALWNGDMLVLINVSDFGVNLRDLTLQSNLDGMILPSNWSMYVDPDTQESYRLTNVRPGSCLIAHLTVRRTGNKPPPLPDTVNCSRIVGVFMVTNPLDLIWTPPSTHITAILDEAPMLTCDLAVSNTCDITLPNGDLNPVVEEIEPTSAPRPRVRAIWNHDIFVVLNPTDLTLDVSTLTFKANIGDGAIDPENWVMLVDPATTAPYTLHAMLPGSCLIAYFIDDAGAPPLPDRVRCERIEGEFTITNYADIIWSTDYEGFTATPNESRTINCDIIGTSSCNVRVD